MHRHGYQGKKFNRERDQREALLVGLADALIRYESIETTLPKAKAVVPYVERLITKAKKGDLHNRRQVIASLHSLQTAHKLVDEVAPKLTARNSGYLRIVKTTSRRGDNVLLARVSFVDDLKPAPAIATPSPKPKATTPKQSTTAKKPTAKKEAVA